MNSKTNHEVSESIPDIKVSAYLIYRTGKLSSFDVLNESITLWNTIIGEGQAEDWSKQTKIFISGKAKNLNMTIKNGDGISLKKKDFNLNGKEEFII